MLLDVSGKFGLTGHLWAHEAAWYNHWYDLFCGTEGEYGAFSSYFGPRLDNEKSRALYGRTEETDAARSETAAEPGEPNLTFAYYPEQKAAYVEVREMNPDGGDWAAEEQKLVDFYRSIEAEGYEHCIIDIRRNPGGSTYYTQILAGPLLTGSYGQYHYYLINGGDEVWDYFDAVGIQRAAIRTIDYLPQEKLPANGLNLDGGSNEELGTAPDIEVPEGEDALEACLRAIEDAGT